MEDFYPNISKEIFETKILKIQENEGNSTLVVNTISEKIQHYNIYETFLVLCKEYNVEFNFSQITNAYKITILSNGYESHSMIYVDRDKDVSLDLASILYSELSIQIKNKDFIAKMNLRS